MKVCLPKEEAPGELIPRKKWSGWMKRMKRIRYKSDCSDNRVGNGSGHDLGHCGGKWNRYKIGN